KRAGRYLGRTELPRGRARAQRPGIQPVRGHPLYVPAQWSPAVKPADRKPGPRHQRGMTTMLVAILLLGILTVTTLFALSIGVFEQRTATNDNRARLVHAAAEAGLNQGIEFFKRNKSLAIEDWLYPTVSGTTIHWVL